MALMPDGLFEAQLIRAMAYASSGGAELGDNPAEPVRIPYQETTLPGYFFRAGDGRRATMILMNGYDGIVEELYFALGAAALRRNLWVHQLDRPSDFVRMAQAYSMNGREQLIKCPAFFCTTEGDELGVHMGGLAPRIGDLAEFVLFRAADDVSGHCEMSNRAALYREVFSWLDRILRSPQQTATTRPPQRGG